MHALGVPPSATDLQSPDDLLRVNGPDGPFVPVGYAGISGREVELRRLVDAVRRIVAVTPRLAGAPEVVDASVRGDLDALVDRLAALVPSPTVAPDDPDGSVDDHPARSVGPDLEFERDRSGTVRVGNPYGMVSGMYSPISPILLDVADDRLVGFATFTDLHEGPPGEVHDGVVSACFDVVLAMANRIHSMFGPTMELTCTRRAPTRVGVPCRFEADVDWFRDKVVVATGRLIQDGEVTAEASGAFRRFDQVGLEAIRSLQSVAQGDVP